MAIVEVRVGLRGVHLGLRNPADTAVVVSIYRCDWRAADGEVHLFRFRNGTTAFAELQEKRARDLIAALEQQSGVKVPAEIVGKALIELANSVASSAFGGAHRHGDAFVGGTGAAGRHRCGRVDSAAGSQRGNGNASGVGRRLQWSNGRGISRIGIGQRKVDRLVGERIALIVFEVKRNRRLVRRRSDGTGANRIAGGAARQNWRW